MDTIRINCGSDAVFADSKNNVWDVDDFFNDNGGAYKNTWNAPDNEIYGTERYFSIWNHDEPFQYDIPVPHEGDYVVVLHFAEIFFTSPQDDIGKRVFDVFVENYLILDGLDIIEKAGYRNPYVVTISLPVIDGKVTIDLIPDKENPKISGIEVYDARNYDD